MIQNSSIANRKGKKRTFKVVTVKSGGKTSKNVSNGTTAISNKDKRIINQINIERATRGEKPFKSLKKVNKKWYVTKSTPRNKDSWVIYANRYGINDRQETKWKTYKAYCMSGKFKAWKRKVLQKARYKCEVCNGQAISAHHKIYRRWGTEKIEDGIALCWPCHDGIHNPRKEK